MRSFASSRSRSAALVVLALATLVTSVAPAQTTELDALLARFRGMEGLSARFDEEKSVALLAAPLHSEGEIHFAPGANGESLLVRNVTAPTTSSALIANGRLVMVSGGRRQEIDLSGNPVVSGFVDSFRHVLAGDRAALERAYRVRLTTDDDGWHLELRPRGAPLDQFLAKLVMHGEGREVRRMEMHEVSGDVTRTTFHHVRYRRWTAAEKQRVFRL